MANDKTYDLNLELTQEELNALCSALTLYKVKGEELYTKQNMLDAADRIRTKAVDFTIKNTKCCGKCKNMVNPFGYWCCNVSRQVVDDFQMACEKYEPKIK